MLFTSVALVGLAALVSAAPHPDVFNSERGITWNPRALEERAKTGGKDKGNNDKIIVDTTFIKIDQTSRGKDQELTILIQEKTVIKDNSNKLKDNIRKNHYKNKNSNSVSTTSTIISD
jgi:hypothetical protein